MRIRYLFAALAAAGLGAGTAAAQVAQPGPAPKPPASNPATTPDNAPPGSKPGTGPATQPDNTPKNPPRGTGPATQPDNGGNPPGSPPTPRPPATAGTVVGGTTTGGTAVGGTAAGGTAVGGTSGGTAVVGGTSAVPVPAELAKLEAQAAVEIPVPAVPAGRAPEARRVAEDAVKVQRATWVVEKLLPGPPDGVSRFDFAAVKVGAHGWLDTTAEVTRTAEGVAIVRPAANVPEGIIIGMPASEAIAVGKTIDLRGDYAIEKAVTVDGRETLLLKAVTPANVLDPAVAKLVTVARKRLEAAKAEYANAVAVLAAAKKKAMDEVLERASVEAAKQLPVPDNATGEERIKAKRDQDDLARKLAQKDVERIVALYGDVPGETARR